MAWVALGAATIGAVGSIGSSLISKNKGSSSSGVDAMGLPTYYQDEKGVSAQNVLNDTSLNILDGNLNDYYKPIGEFGSDEFENILGLANRDITRSVTEDITRRGVTRGGVGTTAISRAVADNTFKLRYQDYIDTISRRSGLLTTGLSTQESVRNAALTEQGQRNQFNQNNAQLALKLQELEDAKNSKKGSMWSNIISGGMSAVGSMIGMGGSESGGTSKINLGSYDSNYGYRTSIQPAIKS